MRFCHSVFFLRLAAWVGVGIAVHHAGVVQAGPITGGAATMTFDISAINPSLTYTRFYGLLDNQAATLTAAQIQSGTVPVPPGSPSTPTNLLHPVNGPLEFRSDERVVWLGIGTQVYRLRNRHGLFYSVS